MAGDKPQAELIELIEAGSRQLREAKTPPGTVEKDGRIKFVTTHEYFGVLTKAWKNEALTWEEVKAFLSQAESQIGTINNIPARFTFSMQEGIEGAKGRKDALNELLTELGVESVKESGDEFSPAEIWDAVYYQAAENKKDYPYLKEARGKKVATASEKVCAKLDKQQQRVIMAFEDGLLAEDIDPRSLTHNKLLARDGVNSVRLNKQQKENKTGKIQVKNTLLLRAKLDRYDVITAFLDQRAEGRGGEEEAPVLGDSQLPAMISYREGEKNIKVQGLSDDEARGLFLILEEVDVFKVKNKQELKPGRGFQGRKGWIAEVTLRRMHEIWKETADVLQRDVANLLTWTSELGHGCMVSEWLSIPGVSEILTWPELYQQREPVTDRPLPMKPIEEIEAILKQRAKDLDIPTSKVDLAIFLSQMLQLGYWTGRVGWKTRHPGEKYGLLDINAGLPIWSWENFVDKSDLSPEQKAVFTPEKRRVFEFQLAELNAFVVGMAMTGYTVEHLGRIPDEASQEDLLYLNEVGEPPIYAMPDDAIIEVVADLDTIPFDEMKQNFQYSFLHQQQIRWQFVYAYYKGLLPKFNSLIGEEAVEKQYINPDNPEHRQRLIEFLQDSNSTAATTLREAGLSPQLITDEVIQALFTDENMLIVNQNRRDFYNQQHPPREIVLQDLVGFSARARTPQELAMILELVLRDKRTWGLDMGTNNSLFNSPELPKQIRKKGGFAADQAGLMVTAEYNRRDHVNTLTQYLEIMARVHLRNEFYTGKDMVEKLSVKFGDLPRIRANSLVNPWTILETAASIRASMMLVGYWDAGYAHTGGRMVTDQETLFDQLDIDRLFQERFYPVIGAAQRVRMGHDGWIKYMKDICLRQRARPSMSLARFYERKFYSQMAPLEGIIEIRMGEGGKHAYVHGVPVYRNGKEDIVYPEDSDYYTAMEERYAEMYYFPASKNKLEQWNSAAKQKQLDEDHARQQIDGVVGLGFMRRWENDRGRKVGLGDLFKVKFDMKNPITGMIQKRIYPIEFMNNLGQNVRSVATDFAMAQGFKIGEYSPEISARYFWDLAKHSPDKLDASGKQIWEDFCGMMIKGWLVDPSLPDSMIPQFYWKWKEMTQAALGITEEGIGGWREPLRLGYQGIKDMVVGEALKFFNKEGSIWQKTLARPGLRANMTARWRADPIPGALKEIKKNFSDKIVFDFVEQMKNAEKEGTFLRDKLGYRQQIKSAFLAGHITEDTYNVLNNLVIASSYRPSLAKNWNNPDYRVHKKWLTVHGFLTEVVTTWLAEQGKMDIKNNLTAQWIFTYLNANPAGYGIAVVATTAVAIGAAGIGVLTSIPAVLTVGGGFLAFQGAATGFSAAIRAVDAISRWASKGRSSVYGTSADGLLFEAEYTGQK